MGLFGDSVCLGVVWFGLGGVEREREMNPIPRIKLCWMWDVGARWGGVGWGGVGGGGES